MFCYVYILQSLKDGSLYIGYTTDLIKRVHSHNKGENPATKPFRQYELIFYEAFLNRIDTKNREIYLKSGYGRRTIKMLLKRYLQNSGCPKLSKTATKRTTNFKHKNNIAIDVSRT